MNDEINALREELAKALVAQRRAEEGRYDLQREINAMRLDGRLDEQRKATLAAALDAERAKVARLEAALGRFAAQEPQEGASGG